MATYRILQEYIQGTSLEGFFLRNEWPLKHSKPWELLFDAKQILENNQPEISSKATIESSVIINGQVWIGANTKIVGATYINGPCFIGENCVIGPNSFLRPWSIIGNECVVGFNCYVTNSLIGNHVGIFHFCSVSRSIIGSNSMLTGYVSTASTNSKLSEIKVKIGNKVSGTGLNKFGCIIGPNTYIGSYSVILPGRIIGQNCLVGAKTIIKNNLPDNVSIICEQSQNIEKRDNIALPNFDVPNIPTHASLNTDKKD